MSDIPVELQAALATHYVLSRIIGRGATATVYLAEDRRHGRAVALKVVRPEAMSLATSERFHREITIAARLNHPHILPLYDSGEANGFLYYVMPYVDGGSLRNRLIQEKQLPIQDAVDIARQVADGLRGAHALGVLHRDIKPENILLTGTHVLVADFGIARVLTQAASVAATTTAGVIVGSPLYMSPEQASGDRELGVQSDLYALGCVLYEMLAGQPPFLGPTVEAILRQHLVTKPPAVMSLRPTTPPILASVVTRALAKVPADRFQSAAELLDGLSHRSPRTPDRSTGGKLMLAVLPLENFSGRSDEDYFSDGMTEELITHLARLSPLQLGVIARTTAMQYKHTQKTVAQIGAELGIQFALEGSARRAGDRVRITVQLIKVDDETHLWAQTYDRSVTDVFAVQEEVAAKVAETLQVKLLDASGTSLEHESTENPQAYDAYLKGQHLARSFFITKRPEDHDAAADLFQRAVDLDAHFSKARAGLARLSFEHYRDYGTQASLDRAESIARALLKIEPDSAAARATLASVYLWSARKELAMREARIALEWNPTEAAAHEALGVAYNMSGLLDRGTAQFVAWRRIDPLAPAPYRRLVDGYIWSGEFEAARGLMTDALALYPQSPVFRRHLARVYYQMREFDKAEELLNASLALELHRGFEARAQLALIRARTGRPDQGESLLTPEVLAYARRDFLESILYPAQFYALTGKPATALQWLEWAVAAGNENYTWFMRNADFDDLRGDPAFQKLLQETKTVHDLYRTRDGR